MKKDMLIMSGKLRIIIPIIVLTILVLFAAFVWPTIYRYDRFHGTVVRINRFTGASEVLSGYGWHKMEEVISAPTAVTAPAPAPEKPMKPYLSQEEAQKLGLENKPVPVPPEDIPDNLKQSGQKPLKPITEYSDEELYKAAGIKPQKKSAK